jgi:hypothetical protein
MKTLIITVIIFFTATGLKAQIENTRERLIDQLKNGTAPGLLFAKNAPAANINNNTVEQKESLVTQIRKGTAPGMKFMTAPGGATTVHSLPNAERPQPAKLASEMEIKKELPRTIAAPPIPTQEEVKQENKQ